MRIGEDNFRLMENKGSYFSKPRSMVDQIYTELAKAISKGILRPGQPIKELDLQNMFTTSRAPIREAIRLLEADGLLIVDTYKKKYVRPITLDTLKEAIPVMACLEGFAAKLAIEKITQEEIGILEKINGEIKNAFDQKDFFLCSQMNFSFHRAYVKLSQNATLIKAIRSIMKNTIWLVTTNLYYNESKLIPISIAEHLQIIEAFKNADPIKVENEVRKHIMNIIGRSSELSVFLSKDMLYPQTY